MCNGRGGTVVQSSSEARVVQKARSSVVTGTQALAFSTVGKQGRVGSEDPTAMGLCFLLCNISRSLCISFYDSNALLAVMQ